MSIYQYMLIAICIGSFSDFAVANDEAGSSDAVEFSVPLSAQDPISFHPPFKITLSNQATDTTSYQTNTPSIETNTLPFQLTEPKNTQSVATKPAPYSEQPLQTDKTLLLEDAINSAIINKQWHKLEGILALYKQQPDHDKLLYNYALGGVYRSQMRHKQAIAAYQKIINTNPKLYYPRFDLGIMLFENKQYQQAQFEITKAKEGLTSQMQQVADGYLQYIKQRQQWQATISVNYETTDNVNNASNARYIYWGGKQWQKTKDSLPQKAKGIRYAFELSRDINLTDNHFWHINTDLDGISYWDNQDYSEQSIRLKTGYKYQDINTTFSLIPFAQQNWLGGDSYSKLLGVSTYSNHRLNRQWQTSASLGYHKKYYHQPVIAKRYDGHTFISSGTLTYSASPSWLLYGGISWSNDSTQDVEKASIRQGYSLGTTKLMQNGLATRLNLQYAKRNFREAGTVVYPFIRQDKEYRVQSEFWHNKIAYKRFVPHLHLSYLHIDSNMSGFYSRDELQWLISIQKIL